MKPHGKDIYQLWGSLAWASLGVLEAVSMITWTTWSHVVAFGQHFSKKYTINNFSVTTRSCKNIQSTIFSVTTRSCVHDYLDHVVTRGHILVSIFQKKYTINNFSVTIFCVTYVFRTMPKFDIPVLAAPVIRAYGAWMSDRWAVSCDPVKYLVVVGRHCKVRVLT